MELKETLRFFCSLANAWLLTHVLVGGPALTFFFPLIYPRSLISLRGLGRK